MMTIIFVHATMKKEGEPDHHRCSFCHLLTTILGHFLKSLYLVKLNWIDPTLSLKFETDCRDCSPQTLKGNKFILDSIDFNREEFRMAFSGTQQKCKACDTTVYLVDQLTADGSVFHKACFRCHHCKGTLKLSNYSSFEGVLYCKPHFDQLFKRTGSLEKSFEGTPKAVKNDKLNDGELKSPSRVSAMFSGTQEKCLACGKTVYPIEKVSVEGVAYHKPCFKCSHGGCVISPSNYIALEGRLYCKHHHNQLFKEKGNYSQLVKTPPVKGASETSVQE